MQNQNRAVFDRGSEPFDMPFAASLTPSTRQHPEGVARSGTAPSPNAGSIARTITRLGAAIIGAWRHRRNRLALLELSDDQLKDIGLSRSQAYGNPDHYRRSNSHDLESRAR